MQLSDKHIEDFRAIYFKRFGKEMDKQEAYGKASQLLRLMELIYQPMTKSQMEKVKARKAELDSRK